MQLSNYIKILLFIHDCVIIPDLGGFVTNYKPAHIDTEKKIFTPPSKSILFNSQLKVNDGLLVNYIATVKNISFSEANSFVKLQVANIQKILATKKKYFFEGIGYLYIDKKQIINFEPNNDINFLVDSFGLSAFQFNELKEYEIRRLANRKIRSNESVKQFVKNKSFYRVAVAASILFVLAILPLRFSIHTNLNQEATLLRLFAEEQIKNYSIIDSLQQQKHSINQPISNPSCIEATLETIIDKRVALFYEEEEDNYKETEQNLMVNNNDSGKIPNIKEESVRIATGKEKVTNIKYWLIAGSFKDPNNATRLRKQLITKGYPAEVISDEKNNYRVVLNSFSEQSEANAELQKVRNNDKSISVWLLTK